VPLPFDWRWFRPELPLMVLFYWVLALPQRVGVFSAMSLGLVLDLLDGIAVGAIAAGSSVGALVILLNYQRLRQFDALQQTFVIGLILAVVLIVVERLQNLLGFASDGLQFLYSIPLSMLLWIPLRNLLRSFRRYYEVG
jgi:rod shape-determining protein MreD